MEKSFILGNPRSGTSLFRLMLNAHPNIVAPPECGFLQWWFDKYKSRITNGQFEYVDDFISDLQKSKKIETWNLNYDYLKENIEQYNPSSYGELCSLIYLSYARKRNESVQVIVDKNNYYVYHLLQLNEIWKDAKYIFMIRDGRDVACSYRALKGLNSNSPYKPHLPYQVREIAMEWYDVNTNILRFLENVPEDRWILIRYEDLLHHTKKELKRITDFFGLKYNPSMLLYFRENQANQEEPLSTLDWKRKTLEKPDITNSGKYKELMSKEELKVFNEVNKELLFKFGYEL